MIKLDAATLRDYEPSKKEIDTIERKPLFIIIDNVLDTYNVGSIFRLADASAVAGVYLVGKTDTPYDPKVGHKIHKASVGTWRWVPWEHTDTVGEAVEKMGNELEKLGNHEIRNVGKSKITRPISPNIVAIEQHENAIPYKEARYDLPLALVVGHETTGVSKEGLQEANQKVEIPLYGVNKSLNVMVSLAIVLWYVIGYNSAHER